MSIKIDITIISLILIWCSIFSIMTHARDGGPQDCDHKENYKACGPAPSCEATCNNRKPSRCAVRCSTGCFCRSPYIRKCEGSLSCLTESQCSAIPKGSKC